MSQTKAQLIDNLVQPITGALGSASAPTFSFTTDPNTGIYSPGADQLAISTGGTGRLFVDSSGRVGVGTASPGKTLDVTGEIRCSSRFQTFGDVISSDWIYVGSSAGARGISSDAISRALLFGINGSEVARFDTSGRLGVGTTSPAHLIDIAGATNPSLRVLNSGVSSFIIRNQGATGTFLSNYEAYPLIFDTNNTERMRIDSSGRVGIGTSSPGAKLDIASLGNASSVPAAIFRGDAGTGNSGGLALYNSSVDVNERNWYIVSNSTVYGDFVIKQGTSQGSDPTSGTNRFYINPSGNVGIGTTSPDAKLSIVATSGTLFKAEYVNVAQLNIGYLGTSENYFDGDKNIFRSGIGTERARIDSSGRLLVGTSTARANFYNQASTYAPRIQLESADPSNGGTMMSTVCAGSSNFSSYLILGKHRGSVGGTPTIVNAGDQIGFITFQGGDGSEMVEAAAIYVEIDGTPGANDMPGRIVLATTADGASGPTERMRIHNGGCVSVANGLVIGSLGAVTNSINISGSVIASGAGNSTLKWNTSSGTVTYDTSSRLVKNQIVNCPYGISEIKQLQPRKYFRTDDQREEIGFIADEMIQVMPEFVPVGAKSVITKDENDTEQIPIGVNYEKLTAVLVKALQEAVAKIESLEARLTAAGI